MAAIFEFALMAGASYFSSRSEINRFPVPDGWQETIIGRRTLSSGFEANSYTNGTEIVISFAGTGPGLDPDWIANFGLVSGSWSDQLGQAAAYYLEVKAANPQATKISFTGHSLGGGLAALMSVFFGSEAQTFNQAPFVASATTQMRDRLVTYLTANGYTQQQLEELAPFFLGPDFDPAIGAAKVTNTSVAGEALSLLADGRIGSPTAPIEHGPANWLLSPIDLHSQALLTAFAQSDSTAESGMALNDVSFKLNDLLKMIFDEDLFARTTNLTNTTEPNFLERLVQHETGGVGAVPVGGDAMLTRFTSDLWKLAQGEVKRS